jgi:hypothetical protein
MVWDSETIWETNDIESSVDISISHSVDVSHKKTLDFSPEIIAKGTSDRNYMVRILAEWQFRLFAILVALCSA